LPGSAFFASLSQGERSSRCARREVHGFDEELDADTDLEDLVLADSDLEEIAEEEFEFEEEE
jgi:hypothetical protein